MRSGFTNDPETLKHLFLAELAQWAKADIRKTPQWLLIKELQVELEKSLPSDSVKEILAALNLNINNKFLDEDLRKEVVHHLAKAINNLYSEYMSEYDFEAIPLNILRNININYNA